MLTSLERKYEALNESLVKLAKKADEGVPILVEGTKDLVALERLGIRGKIICVKNSNKVLVDLLDTIKDKETVVLVDFDRTGERLAERIVTYLQRKGVNANSGLWKRIGLLVKHDVKDVEGLPSYLEKIKENLKKQL
ncbi:MAG: toprim domain-containing protein [Candidatus Bathyarchaeota archaeon]|nr:toprim domain-containing protein [Candidatus Bathyarchaeota archaeon]